MMPENLDVYVDVEATKDYLRERCKKRGKKLTNVSFAFTHTYTLKN